MTTACTWVTQPTYPSVSKLITMAEAPFGRLAVAQSIWFITNNTHPKRSHRPRATDQTLDARQETRAHQRRSIEAKIAGKTADSLIGATKSSTGVPLAPLRFLPRPYPASTCLHFIL